jgi:Skp family chaperone for outer membrane proteins
MKTFRSVAAFLFFAAFLTATTFAQTGTAPAGSSRIAVVNTQAFGSEKGLTKLIAAATTVDREIKPRRDEYEGMGTRLNQIARDIENLRKTPGVVPQAEIDKKQREGEDLQLKMKAKKEEGDAFAKRRTEDVMNPIFEDIGNALEDYRKSKGYSMILDSSKLVPSGVIIAVGDDSDVTEDFIKFYNARPAGTASAAPATRPAATRRP